VLTPDVVSGMIKLHLNGYVSYNELVDWASAKFNHSEFVQAASDDHCDAMFDVLSTIMLGRSGDARLNANELASFVSRLESITTAG